MLKEIYEPKDIVHLFPSYKLRKKFKNVSYYNIPISFDIETTSFYDYSSDVCGDKVAIMYVWALDINGNVIMGRTWDEFIKVCDYLVKRCKLYHDKRRIIIFVHNLAYEFAFFSQYFEWKKVFAIDKRRPLYALTTSGIEFRCSYLLSGYKLETVGKNLQKYKVQKLVGQLDYSLIRHTKTELTAKEKEYLVNDVLVVESYIREQIEEFNGIGNIPLTKTGKVRLYCRRECFGRSHDHVNHYRQTIKKLTLTPEEFKLCEDAFQGGFTHANPHHVMKNRYGVKSYDFCSSYPAQLIASGRYPMSAPKHATITKKSELKYYLKHYACIFEITFINIESQVTFENPISKSHCKNLMNETTNNGRIVKAGMLTTTITELDFEIYEKFYKWDKIQIGKFIYFERGYLPTEFVKSVLDLYGRKTTLKNVPTKEQEYQNGKEMLNSTYGCCVTNPCREENIFDGEKWLPAKKPDIETALNKYNNNWQRFLYYPWGIFCTSLSRTALFSGIWEFKNDYIYADTDSLKVLNYEKHEQYIKKYNQFIHKQLCDAMDFHGLTHDLIEPKTAEGIKKPLGIWEDEGIYDVFKTCGAKRYITLKHGKLEITIAGVNKKQGAEYMIQTFGKYGAFQHFNFDLEFPAGHTGKMVLSYCDTGAIGTVTDYNGIIADYEEKSYVHMEESSYDMSDRSKIIDYIEQLEGVEWII